MANKNTKKHGSCRYMPNNGIIHCKVDGAIINITEGMLDARGRKVTGIQIHPDNYVGGRPWKVIPRVHNVRIIEV